MSTEPHRWPEVSDEEANAYRRDPARRVERVGNALLVVGCLGLVTNFLAVEGLQALPVLAETSTAKHPAARRGPISSPSFDCFLVGIPTVAVYSLVIAGGYRLRQAQNRRLGITAAVLALAPCSPALLAGLPVGVWALAVLTDPAVRAAFAGRRREG
jgi:hypothetical protein